MMDETIIPLYAFSRNVKKRQQTISYKSEC